MLNLNRKITLVVCLVYVQSFNGAVAQAQPPIRPRVDPNQPRGFQVNGVPVHVTTEAERRRDEVQNAEASAQVISFAIEALKSQSGPGEFAKWPVALRDSLPYWLDFRPVLAWSPELRQFAAQKFEAFARDADTATNNSKAKDRAAIAAWLKEAEPWRDFDLRFKLEMRFTVAGFKNGVRTNGYTLITRLPAAAGNYLQKVSRFLATLSPEQKAEMFANKMRLPVARLSQEQKIIYEAFFRPGHATGNVPIDQLPEAQVSVDFEFKAEAARGIEFPTDDMRGRQVNEGLIHYQVPLAHPFAAHPGE